MDKYRTERRTTQDERASGDGDPFGLAYVGAAKSPQCKSPLTVDQKVRGKTAVLQVNLRY